ncbi:N-methylhydantoinase A [Parvibaculum indicum]|uniref:hydantoinase/oxoprolinase family protein n=1 Tax=Parvibaculum indicum TaxID=562969 RepID=UPI0014210140|nr:hydantoinase/oxoprolinase family protein [Parvibaculum indicum]NIJ43003.1 N-methylhydantoinase A [Parvibaculum indicum]
MTKTIRIGIDIGGTFTDFVLRDEVRDMTRTGKLLTTPENPSRAIIDGVKRLLDETNSRAEQILGIVHGTTLITNTVLERTGARVGLITTGGFADTLEMGHETRYDVDDLFQRPAPVIVPRNLRRGVGGRMFADGRECETLDEDAVAREVRQLVEDEGIEALAISFMHAYRNPAHEKQALEVVRAIYPDLLVTLSSDVAPEIREFERTNTACVNAYVQPRVHDYLDRLTGELAELGFAGNLSIMLSSGGLTTIEEAKAYPVRLIESGPAAGAMAAAYIARQIGEDHLLSFDMGGTTAKMCVIENAEPHVKYDFEAGRLERFKPGSGLPLKVTVIDMIEISGGGGSMAVVDDLGLMKVGPRSAGSVPGPVAYGRGGEVPTVTDADLLLGYLNPDYFLGGEMALSLETVRDAVKEKLASPLGIGTEQAAEGIQKIINENMTAATRMHLAEKGKDPRSYSMVAFGGAGPVHAYGLAKLLKVRRIVVPMGAGVISAFGFLVAAPTTDSARGYFARLDRIDWDEVNALYAEMQADACKLLVETGAATEDIRFQWKADMRYHGQGFEITVPLPQGPLSSDDTKAVREAFDRTYGELFGRTVPGIPVEVVNWRLSSSLDAQDISLAHDPVETPAERPSREVFFPDFGKIETPVYDRYALRPGTVIDGPAIFEERETSFNVGPDATVAVDEFSNLIVEIREPGSQ